jgi:hypothetical protein
MVENFLRVRFGEIDAELAGAITPMLQLPPEVLTRLLLAFLSRIYYCGLARVLGEI